MTGILYRLKAKLSNFWNHVKSLLSMQGITQIVTKQLLLELQTMPEKSSDPEKPLFKRGDIVFILFNPNHVGVWPMLGTNSESDCKILTSRFIKHSSDDKLLMERRPELFRNISKDNYWAYNVIAGRTGTLLPGVPEKYLVGAKNALESLANERVRLTIDTELAPAGTCFFLGAKSEYFMNEELGIYLHKSRIEAKQTIFEKY